MGDTVVAIYYTPPDQEEDIHEAFCRQVKVVPQLQVQVLMGYFSQTGIHSKGYTVRDARSRRLMISPEY